MTVRRSDELVALAWRRRAEVAAVCARHGCRNPRVVGSDAAGDADSDLDLMVDVDEVRTLFDLAAGGLELTDLLGVTIDVVPGPRPSQADPSTAERMDAGRGGAA